MDAMTLRDAKEPSQLGAIGDSRSLSHLAYEALSDYLVDGGLEPGDRLAEVQLANALGVSRGPIRQALQQLAAEGWVEIRPRFGAFVAQRDRKSANDFFLVRHNLEVLAARQAATNRTDDDLAHLRRCIEDARERASAIPEGSSRSEAQARQFHRETSVRFHELIAEATHNDTLRDLLHVLVKKTRWYFTPGVLGHSPRAWREHEELVAALEAGDPAECEAMMDLHMQRTLASYLENLD
jgi:DNA-binding GntR family transcriptional regulator